MLRTLICLSLVFAGALARAEDQAAAPAPDATAQDAATETTTTEKSIFESQTKEDVEKMNQVDKSLVEVSGASHPDE